MAEYDPRRPTPTFRPRGLRLILSSTPRKRKRSPKKQLAFVIDRDGRRCCWCGHTGVKLTREHIIPRSDRGTDEDENIKAACASCNHARGSIPAGEWQAVVDEVMACAPGLANDEIGPRARRLWLRRHRAALPPDPDDYRLTPRDP